MPQVVSDEHHLLLAYVVSEPDPAWDDDVIAPGTPLKVSPGARARRRAGQRVHHEDFGNGVIVSAEPVGDDCKYTVRFGTRIKKVMGRFLSGAAGNGS